MYAKNVAFPSSFLCNSLLKEKLFLENEEKTSETKNRFCFPIDL